MNKKILKLLTINKFVFLLFLAIFVVSCDSGGGSSDTPTYYNNYGGGSQPSFTGSSSKVFSRSVKFYNIDGSYCYGTYDLQTDGTYEYFNGSLAQRPSYSNFNYFVPFGGGYAYFY